MNFQICSGNQEKAGVTRQKDIISFSRQAAENSICYLLLYPRDGSPDLRIPMEAKGNCGTMYTVGIQGLDWKNYDYNFEINGEEALDKYARKITGREIWQMRPEGQKSRTRSHLCHRKTGGSWNRLRGDIFWRRGDMVRRRL